MSPQYLIFRKRLRTSPVLAINLHRAKDHSAGSIPQVIARLALVLRRLATIFLPLSIDGVPNLQLGRTFDTLDLILSKYDFEWTSQD